MTHPGDLGRITLARWVGDDGSWEVRVAEGDLVARTAREWVLITARGWERFPAEWWSPLDVPLSEVLGARPS